MPHHVAHAASAGLAAPFDGDCAVLVLDGRGERHSHLGGRFCDGTLHTLYSQQLPHSLGLLYEDATQHLGFLRSSDEYKVMALASYGKPRHLDYLRQFVHATRRRWLPHVGRGLERAGPEALGRSSPGPPSTRIWPPACRRSSKRCCSTLAEWLHDQTHARNLALAGGVALNCVANTRLFAESGFDQVWVQPAAGDAGTALGGALYVAQRLGDVHPEFPGADLGREWTDEELEAALRTAKIPYDRPADIADAVAEELADDGIVAWFQGRSEFGPRALGHRSLLAHPGRESNLRRLNDVKGREQFRPVAPMVLASRAAELFSRGPDPVAVHALRP